MRHFLLFTCLSVGSLLGIAQEEAERPSTEKVYLQDPQTGTWNLTRSSRYAYLSSGERVLDDRLVYATGEPAPIPSRIETRYDDVGRELANWFLYFDEARQVLDTAFYTTYVYNERGQLTLFSIYDQLDSTDLVLSRRDRYSYGDNGCLTQVVRSSLMQDFRESRELSDFQKVDYQRGPGCHLIQQTEVALQQPEATYRTEFVRDLEGRPLAKLVFFLNAQGQEDLTLVEINQYDDQGRLFSQEITTYPIFRADTLLRRSTFTYEGDLLAPLAELVEVYSSTNPKWQTVREVISFIDPKGIVRPEYRLVAYEAQPNSTRAIDNYVYQFSPDGDLIQLESEQVVDRDGEILGRTTVQERYSRDCEGKVTEKLSFRENYRVPSFGDPFTQTFSNRFEYTYLPNEACTGLPPAYAVKAYPNPTRGEVWIESELFSLKGSEVEVLSLDGRVLQHLEGLLAEAMLLRLGDLPGGMYQVRVRNEAQGLSFSTKVALVRP
ncbi:MAG: T9SS type A sorting domain-containing protein [Bacteroidota bacterium]